MPAWLACSAIESASFASSGLGGPRLLEASCVGGLVVLLFSIMENDRRGFPYWQVMVFRIGK